MSLSRIESEAGDCTASGKGNSLAALEALIAESKQCAPVNFVKLAAELNEAYDEIGGLPKTIVRLLRKRSVAPSTKAQLARLSMEIFFRAMEQQPPGLEPASLTPEQLTAAMEHLKDELDRRQSPGSTPAADEFGA